MKRVGTSARELLEHRSETPAVADEELLAKRRRARLAEAQEKILATYVETFRRLAE